MQEIIVHRVKKRRKKKLFLQTNVCKGETIRGSLMFQNKDIPPRQLHREAYFLKLNTKAASKEEKTKIVFSYTPRKPELKETHVPQCSSQHCL